VTRSELEHLVRAAATIAGDSEIVIIGSQAILGRHPDAPPELLVSQESFPRAGPPHWFQSHGLADRTVLLERLEQTPIDQARRDTLRSQIEADFATRGLAQ
jgi:hypothetical protein